MILNGKGRNIASIAPDAIIAEAVTRLRERNYDIHECHILGIISGRDVIHAFAASAGAGDVLDLVRPRTS